jgi:hypothetical protein
VPPQESSGTILKKQDLVAQLGSSRERVAFIHGKRPRHHNKKHPHPPSNACPTIVNIRLVHTIPMTMDGFNFNAQEEERRMRIMRSLGEHSKYDSQGGRSVIPPSLGHAAAAAASGLPFGGSSFGAAGISDSQGLGLGNLSSGLQDRGVDYASLIRQRFLEEQSQRDFMSQAAMLGSQLGSQLGNLGLTQPSSHLPPTRQSAPAFADPSRVQDETTMVEEFIRRAFEQRALERRLREDTTSHSLRAPTQAFRSPEQHLRKPPLECALEESRRKRRRVEREAAPVLIVPNSKATKAAFPLPSRSREPNRSFVGSLSSFKDKWNDLEEKAAALPGGSINKAFIAELFARRLNERIDTVGNGVPTGESIDSEPGRLKKDM